MQRFCRAPAAKVNHHAYLGGLLEHTVSMLRAATRLIPLYPVLNGDLLLVGIFLHDIGKTSELAYQKEFDYTDSGRLVGHLVQGTLMLQAKVAGLRAAGTEIPDILVEQLMHLILAHHGEYEFGSPKLPMTPEAVAAHYIDNLDARLQAFSQAIEDHPVDEESWTARQFMFDNQMLFRGTAEERQRRRAATDESADDEDGGPAPPRRGGLD
jgi:3'-5' exoribonuclease